MADKPKPPPFTLSNIRLGTLGSGSFDTGISLGEGARLRARDLSITGNFRVGIDAGKGAELDLARIFISNGIDREFVEAIGNDLRNGMDQSAAAEKYADRAKSYGLDIPDLVKRGVDLIDLFQRILSMLG
ncbi:MAG: hypothetical protein J0H17_12460 [Rhizobiales bacterium]|nr:hypothetical protein [Hyphomicrobiales bacterium]